MHQCAGTADKSYIQRQKWPTRQEVIHELGHGPERPGRIKEIYLQGQAISIPVTFANASLIKRWILTASLNGGK